MVAFNYSTEHNELTCVFEEPRMDSVATQKIFDVVRDKLNAVLAESGDRASSLSVTLDLAKIDYLSSMFLRLIGMIANTTSNKNVNVVNASRDIRDLFKTAGMESLLSGEVMDDEDDKIPVFPPPAEFAENAHVKSLDEYRQLHRRSLEEPEAFWGEMANRHLVWDQPWKTVRSWENNHAKWFEGGKLNAAANCLDKNIAVNPDKTAIIWEGEPLENGNPEIRRISYAELHRDVCQFANALHKKGVDKGDRVVIYMPMVPETVVAMLACARIGAMHSVIFAGFSPQAIAERVADCQATLIITCDGGYRRGQPIALKKKVDEAFDENGENGEPLCGSVKGVVVLKRTGLDVDMVADRDQWWNDFIADAEPSCPPVPMDAEDGLFILYTSGSTGKPKGVYHTTAGYLLGTALSHHYVFDLKPDDVYWCTADVGWITGHSYIVYGPLINGATIMIYEGAPNHPDPGRFWDVIERHGVTLFYTAPTAIRAFMGWGDQWPDEHDLSSLRLLGTVGEPINPHAWMWYHEKIGGERCPIVDTWWQTETGAIMIAPFPGAVPTKPGSATLPFLGVDPDLIDDQGNPVTKPGETGNLIIRSPWPSMLRGLWNAEERYQATYWSDHPGNYSTGDGARRDKDGYIWITGRVDDVINVSGHRIGTAEIESALISHESVAEAAAVGRADDVKGFVIVVFVTLKANVECHDDLAAELRNYVGGQLGAVTKPEEVRFVDGLPKTRSGKIMRRFLKQIAAGTDISGDVTTLEDLNVLANICVGDGQS